MTVRTAAAAPEAARSGRDGERQTGLTRASARLEALPMHVHYNRIAGSDVGRIEALSDGVFAFAATVLVLDFHSPDPADIHSEAELLRVLAGSAPRLLPWLLSFLTLGIFWLGQRTQLSQLSRSATRMATPTQADEVAPAFGWLRRLREANRRAGEDEARLAKGSRLRCFRSWISLTPRLGGYRNLRSFPYVVPLRSFP
jgi:hypothetical protein